MGGGCAFEARRGVGKLGGVEEEKDCEEYDAREVLANGGNGWDIEKSGGGKDGHSFC